MRIGIIPMLIKEIKTNMRGWKTPVVIAAYLSIIAVTAVFVISISKGDPMTEAINLDQSQTAYSYLSTMEFLLVLFISPALAASSISGEREGQTMDILMSTRIHGFSVVLGKLAASVAYMLLLIAASFPLFSIVFLFGGISLGKVLQLLGFLLITSLMFSSAGIFFSTYLRKGSLAAIAVYCLVIVLSIGTVFAADMYNSYSALSQGTASRSTPSILYSNPLTGFGSLISEQYGIKNMFTIPKVPVSIIPPSIIPSAVGKGTQITMWKGNMRFDIYLSAAFIALSVLKIIPAKRNLFKDAGRILKRSKTDTTVIEQ
jgi:ABC-type transport system involved in multi-copper enzyme maturation permease subunit